MTTAPSATRPLWSRGMAAVLFAQFFSAFGDNAVLFAALALLKSLAYPDWAAPLLQQFFVAAYILLAPFAGPFADSFPKGRVMLIANGLKLAGAACLLAGLDPFLAYGLIGVGAAAYSPAKYGILGELTSGDQLVKANGLMEASTIAAILTGAIAGGVLADHGVTLALGVCAGVYAAAAAANLLIPRLPAAHPLKNVSARSLLGDFIAALRSIWRHPDTRFSIIGTSLFWGSGVTMRFLLVAWVPIALGITDNATPAYLNAMVAVGIVLGAGLAGACVRLEQVERALPAGVGIGLAVAALALVHSLAPAYALLAVVGACGGFFIVPLNALLQERGKETVGAGHAIAIQNLGENGAMLLMLGLYTLALGAGTPVLWIAPLFGLGLSAAISVLWLARRRQR
ncbi:lysophospholipid transporter LplT [Plasticicumulans acidivorans]|uniref:LPLT family lysophospholipid transporter-like MFS transporter n=1 Tax=Plasticicumulans acidivorans TaxID=886464 RepID=A0A317MTW4_9GAMM|nr:lysophospholipid transporter LplT [Plasticicumulans acidivorans]PWV60545.1 LPLT family lysophospholipid transporter-like MFS transporter [Plasticicumulans acidivorans]